MCRKGVEAFLQHAIETNDIFILAAKLVCKVLLKANKLFNLMCETRLEFTPATSLFHEPVMTYVGQLADTQCKG